MRSNSLNILPLGSISISRSSSSVGKNSKDSVMRPFYSFCTDSKILDIFVDRFERSKVLRFWFTLNISIYNLKILILYFIYDLIREFAACQLTWLGLEHLILFHWTPSQHTRLYTDTIIDAAKIHACTSYQYFILAFCILIFFYLFILYLYYIY